MFRPTVVILRPLKSQKLYCTMASFSVKNWQFSFTFYKIHVALSLPPLWWLLQF